MTAPDNRRHGINNALARIMSTAELVLEATSDPSQRADLEAIIAAVEDASALLNSPALPTPRQTRTRRRVDRAGGSSGA
jgi:hypothetical protein